MKDTANMRVSYIVLLVVLLCLCLASGKKRKSRFRWKRPRYVMPWLKGPNVCAVEEVTGSRKRYYSECMAYQPREICGKPTYIRYHCCTGFEATGDTDGCQGVAPTENLMKTAKHLYLKDFRKYAKKSDVIADRLTDGGAYTIFAPQNAAFSNLPREVRSKFNKGDPESNLLSYHTVNQRYHSQDLHNDIEIPSLYVDELLAENATIRVNRYSNGVITVNCARIILPNQPATNGIMHVIEKVIQPIDIAARSVMEKVLFDSNVGEFTTALVTKLNDLPNRLRDSASSFTIFAPTDKAFRDAPPELMSRVINDNDMLAKLLQYHILDSSICTSAILGPTSLQTIEGQKVELSCDGRDRLTINGIHVANKDDVAYNGVVHTIDKLLIPDSVKTLKEKLTELGLHEFEEYVQGAGLSEIMAETSGSHTVFAPNADAFRNLTEEQRRILLTSTEASKRVFSYHVIPDHVTTKQMVGDNTFQTYASSGPVKAYSNMKVYNKDFGVNSARIVKQDTEVANGVIHVVDRVLWPPEGLAMDKIHEDPQLKTFMSLLLMSGLDELLMKKDLHLTVFAPTDDAFDAMDRSVLESLMLHEDALKQFLRNHMIHTSNYLRTMEDKWRYRFKSMEGEWIEVKRKSHGSREIINENSKVVEKDIQITNGVIHKIDTVLHCSCIERFLNEVPMP